MHMHIFVPESIAADWPVTSWSRNVALLQWCGDETVLVA